MDDDIRSTIERRTRNLDTDFHIPNKYFDDSVFKNRVYHHLDELNQHAAKHRYVIYRKPRDEWSRLIGVNVQLRSIERIKLGRLKIGLAVGTGLVVFTGLMLDT